MKKKEFHCTVELFRGEPVVWLPDEIVKAHHITPQTRYRMVSESPKKLAIVLE